MLFIVMSTPNIIIEKIHVDDVNNDAASREKYNSSNHWDNGRPEDYSDVLSMSQTKHWIDLFHSSYYVINIDPIDVRWMKEAARVGIHTAQVSRLHKEDFAEAVEKYTDRLSHIFDGTEYFVRSDTVSLKEGLNGAGPYTDVKSIIESLITCRSTHTPVRDDTESIKLYLLPWLKMDSDREFRVFVHQNRVTAISQQHLYTTNTILNNSPDSDKIIQEWVTTINDYFERTIKKRIKHLSSYVIDIAITDSGPYFIEINSFGKGYASGSSLFHWLIDEDKLYGADPNKIHFRYTYKN